MDVFITITGLCEADGETARTTLSVPGTLTVKPDGYMLTYRNTGEGMTDVTTTLTVGRRGAVIVNRGGVQSRLILEPGRTHENRYDTGCGILTLTTDAVSVENGLDALPGTLTLHYTLRCDKSESRHLLTLSVRPL